MRYFLLLILAVYALPSFAQSGRDYDDLLELFVDEKYERLVYKAYDFTQNDKYKKDPMPYLYYSMGHFAFTKDEGLSEKYKNAFKEALKYASKFVKKDKEKEYLDEAEDYFEELREAAAEEAENQLINQKFTKAKGMYKYLCGLDQKDPGAKMAMGYSAFMMRSSREGETFLTEGVTILQEINPEDLSTEQQSLLKNILITLMEWTDNSSYRGQITTAVEKSKDLFSDQKDFNLAYQDFM